jgi:hypothetical protein
MTHKEFFIWLNGFMTNRSWTVIQQKDIEIIQEKMKEVRDEFNINDFLKRGKDRSINPTIVVDSKEQLND